MSTAAPPASIRVNGKEFSSNVGRLITIGRDPSCDVHLDDPKVSRYHAVLQHGPQGWVIRDVGSHNGTFRDGGRVTELLIAGPVRLSLGAVTDGVALDLAPVTPSVAPRAHRTAQPHRPAAPAQPKTAPTPMAAPPVPGPVPPAVTRPAPPAVAGRVRIGRTPDNDLALTDDLRVSRHHAELLRGADGTSEIVDLKSSNGTFVNGQRIQRARLAEGDVVTIGNHVFRFTHGTLDAFDEDLLGTFEASGLTVRTDQGKKILDGVSFYLEASKLMAVVGPSGSGKTTLLNAITGFRPAQSGQVLFGGRDLYASFDDLRQRIGFVPQDDILHPQLAVRKALQFAAELRFPQDVDARTRNQRVAEVMEELDLTERADVRIERLSGGQRKRVSVALELLTKPSLLFLDEPTSGLDPGNERQVMALLRELADGGRTVIVVTHSTQSLHLCDRVLFMAPGGRVAYYGPPAEALAYFSKQGAGKFYADVFTALEEHADRDWAGAFRSDPAYTTYVGQPIAAEAAVLAARPQQATPQKAQQPWGRQFRVLVRRYLAVIVSDRRTLLLLALQAPIFGILFSLLIGKNRLSMAHGPEGLFLIWLLVVGATWLGVSNATREIVKELPIYRRERSVGLSIQAYVASKVAVLGTLTVAQVIVMAVIALQKQHLGDPRKMDFFFKSSTGQQQSLVQAMQRSPVLADIFKGQSAFGAGAATRSATGELMLDLVLVGLAAMALGLLVSAIVKSSDQALVLLPLLLVTQVVVSQPFTAQASINQDVIRKACANLQSATQIPPSVRKTLEPQSSGSSAVLSFLGFLSSAEWGKDAAGSTADMNVLRSLSLITQAVGERDIAIGFGQAQVPSQCEFQEIVRVGLVGQPRWRHASGAWGKTIFALLVLLAIPLLGAFYFLRKQDVHAVSAESTLRRRELQKIFGALRGAAGTARARRA